MAKYTVPIDSYESFKKAVNGNCYDIDDTYGCQCWDGACLLWTQIGSYLETGGRDAKGCWLVESARQANTVPGYFIQVTNKEDIKIGDVIVLDQNAGAVGVTGHIGFADEDYRGARIRMLGQNQGIDGGILGKPFNLYEYPLASFLGAFRFISWQGAKPKKSKKHKYPFIIAKNHWGLF